ALLLCCELGHSECAQMLIEHGANVNHRDAIGRTCLHYCIHAEGEAKPHRKKDFQTILALLLEKKPNLDIVENKFKWTPMFQAIRGGNVDIVDQLSQLGANLDLTDHKGNSLLHVAVEYNQFHVLEFLVRASDRDWNYQHKNNDGDTPFRLSVLKGHTECAKILTVFEQPTTLKKALLLAVKNDRTPVSLLFIITVIITIINNLSLLVNFIIVKYLLRDLKLNPNFQDKAMMTPLRWAAYLGFKQILKELLIHQADDPLDDYGQNVVFYAAKKGHIECLDLLAKADADFNIRNNEGVTALEKACNKETARFIKKVREQKLNEVHL
ncbi:ankyrin repeat protein, partial [Reticulomyxa filosa]